jgi:opacity protein-like surface antigen
MIRSTAVLIAVLSIGGVSRSDAQETSPGPGTVEVTVIPGGATFFTNGKGGSSFGNYNLGGALTYNINRIVGVEGEVVGSLGIAQDLQFGGLTSNTKSPNSLAYTGNVVLSLPTHSSFVPYATGGKPRRQQRRDVSDGKRRRRREVVRTERDLGTAR